LTIAASGRGGRAVKTSSGAAQGRRTVKTPQESASEPPTGLYGGELRNMFLRYACPALPLTALVTEHSHFAATIVRYQEGVSWLYKGTCLEKQAGACCVTQLR
jgi:hypothetical protein